MVVPLITPHAITFFQCANIIIEPFPARPRRPIVDLLQPVSSSSTPLHNKPTITPYTQAHFALHAASFAFGHAVNSLTAT